MCKVATEIQSTTYYPLLCNVRYICHFSDFQSVHSGKHLFYQSKTVDATYKESVTYHRYIILHVPVLFKVHFKRTIMKN